MASFVKRKHKTILLKEKCEILKCLDGGQTIRQVAIKFNIPKSTISVAYRKQLLVHILSENDNNVAQILKNFNLRIAVEYLDNAWQTITEKNIQRSWSALWPQLTSQWDDEDMMPLQDLRLELLSGSVYADLKSIRNIIGAISLNNEITEKEINEWATGVNEFSMDLSDNEIIEHAANQLSDSEEDQDIIHVKNKISNEDAMKSFAVCVQWAEENELEIQDILLLKRLEEKARNNYLKKIMQPKINEFFHT